MTSVVMSNSSINMTPLVIAFPTDLPLCESTGFIKGILPPHQWFPALVLDCWFWGYHWILWTLGTIVGVLCWV